MDYLNFYSLKKNKNTNEPRADSAKKLFNLNNVTYNFLFIYENKVITKEKNPFFLKTRRISKDFHNLSLSYITNFGNNYYLLCSLKDQEIKKITFLKNCFFLNIREALLSLKQKYASLVSAGYSLYRWQNSNIYCSRCGSKTTHDNNGNSIVCTKNKCGKKNFPIVYPTIIVNVTYKNMILLARNIGWKKNLYSCLAGFCEQNESAEAAVRREVYEEVGLNLEEVNYKYSQFWPFTSNLMLGFEARVVSKKNTIKINRNEIDEAKWFSSKEIIELNRKNELILPIKEAIAHSLIQDWINKN